MDCLLRPIVEEQSLQAMFFYSVFDSLLLRPPNKSDITSFEEVQRVLREEIVNPLRKNLFVRADRVMKLRTLLDSLTSVTGLTCEEKGPLHRLTSIFSQFFVVFFSNFDNQIFTIALN